MSDERLLPSVNTSSSKNQRAKRVNLQNRINELYIQQDSPLKNTPYPEDPFPHLSFMPGLTNEDIINLSPFIDATADFPLLYTFPNVVRSLVRRLRNGYNASNNEIDRLTKINKQQRQELVQLRARRQGSVSTVGSEAYGTATDPQILEILNRLTSRPNKPEKSAKLPDPKAFTGEPGKEPTFRRQKADIRNKIIVNRDYFRSDLARVAYLFLRTSGQANTILRPYIETKSPQVSTFDLAIGLLTDTFNDPYFIENKKQELRQLYQRNKTFTEFYALFITTAIDAGLARLE